MQDVTSNIQSIASVGEQQSAIATEVAENVNVIATASEQSAATAVDASTAANILSKNADTLMNLANAFKAA